MPSPNLKKKKNAQSGANHVSSLERAFADSGANELDEITENVPSVPLPTPVLGVASQGNIIQQADNSGTANAISRGRGNGRSRGRGRRSFIRQTGESDPYDMSVAPLNIYENQVIPVGLHNLSECFRPNLSAIRVLSLGTKCIPKWNFEKKREHICLFLTTDNAK